MGALATGPAGRSLPAPVPLDREALVRMRAGLIRAVREIDTALGLQGTFSKDSQFK